MAISDWGLSDKGFSRPTFNDILDAKISKAKELFGEDVDTSEFSNIGKFIRIDAYDLAKAYEDLELIYYARFPNTASGSSLDRLCVFARISRNPATAATHKVTIAGTEGKTIPAGFTVSIGTADEDAITFRSVEDVTLGIIYIETTDSAIDDEKTYYTKSGDTYTAISAPTFVDIDTYYEQITGGVVTVKCVETGTIGNVGANAINTIVNPNADVTGIICSELLSYGDVEESDYELRKRFSQAIEGAGSANVNAIRAAILRVPTVISAGIIENDTNETDSKGRPPHSFECFVYGGENYEQEIGEAIFSKKPLGIKAVSTSTMPVSVDVLDDGGHTHTIKFSHTEDINVKINITIKKNNTFETDGVQQIRTNLTDYINNLGVGAPVIISSLYGYIHAVTGVTEVTSLTVSIDGGSTYTTDNVSVNDWQVAKTTADSIDITEALHD